MPPVAIRGATTIDIDNEQQITSRSLELYREIVGQNNLNESDIIYIHITSTADITAYYPATALRLSGCNSPLFSSLEPPIKGSLPLCIRFLVLANSDKKPNHTYLHNAENLRRNK